jgi:hypothetical protein
LPKKRRSVVTTRVSTQLKGPSDARPAHAALPGLPPCQPQQDVQILPLQPLQPDRLVSPPSLNHSTTLRDLRRASTNFRPVQSAHSDLAQLAKSHDFVSLPSHPTHSNVHRPTAW